jgi:hypothetical protein
MGMHVTGREFVRCIVRIQPRLIAPKGLISLAFSKIFLDLGAATH